MEQTVPDDQQILEEYFDLATNKKTEKCSWLYGMIATYGVTPNELEGFSWNKDYSINIKSKKRSVKPLHPQWIILFNLMKKQPCKKQDCFKSSDLKVKELLQAHKIRRNIYRLSKLKQGYLSPVAAA